MGILKVSESQQFADRSRSALESAGVRASLTLVANVFNLGCRGRSITPHKALNCLLGKVVLRRAHREMVDRYLWLPLKKLKTIRNVVSAFVVAKSAEKLLSSLGPDPSSFIGLSVTSHWASTAQWRHGCPRIISAIFTDQASVCASKSYAQDGLGTRH